MTKSYGAVGVGRVPLGVKAALASVLGVMFAFAHADGYRFFPAVDEVRSPDAERWSPEVWGPGDSLVFDIAPHPLWETYFGSLERLIERVEYAMASWEAIPTADISWRFDGVADRPRVMGDNRNTIFLDPDPNTFSGAGIVTKRRGDGTSEIVECDYSFARPFAPAPDGIEPAHWEGMLDLAVNGSVHELGHCLGLHHAGDFSTTGRWGRRQYVHPRDPIMSYGRVRGHAEIITPDDAVGASLLRPRGRWPPTTGNIAGVVTVNGKPVQYVHVWVLPAGDRPLRDRIEVMSDRTGAFLIEGLDPGEYAFWAQPVASQGALPWVIERGGPIDLEDAIRGALVRVRAGRTTGSVDISLRRGRAPRPPPREAPPPRNRRSLGGTDAGPAEVCPGVHVTAGRPYPPDGPLWFTGRGFEIGRDRWWGTTVTVEWSAGSESVFLDWAGAYRNWEWKREDNEEGPAFFGTVGEAGLDARTSRLDVAISDYRIRKTAAGVRHTMDIAWPESTETVLRFRSEDGGCDGEPKLICDFSGCELMRQ